MKKTTKNECTRDCKREPSIKILTKFKENFRSGENSKEKNVKD